MVESLHLTQEIDVAARRLQNERRGEAFEMFQKPRKMSQFVTDAAEHIGDWHMQGGRWLAAICLRFHIQRFRREGKG